MRIRRGVEVDRLPALRPAEVVDGLVREDRDDPGPELRTLVERGQTGDGCEQRLLDQVLRGGLILHRSLRDDAQHGLEGADVVFRQAHAKASCNVSGIRSTKTGWRRWLGP